jgi:predicted RNA binding protein YcfA (HicA-like mRNA interferase family)
MKLAELERHLRLHGRVLYREGAAHSIWFNPVLHKIASVRRHREIKEGTIRAICKQPEIPRP